MENEPLKRLDAAMLRAGETDALATEVSRIKVERERWRWKCLEIDRAKFRVIRALRLALTALHDVRGDVSSVAPYDSPKTKEVRAAQTKAWNIVCPLLVEAGKLLKANEKDPVLADLSCLIQECDNILGMKAEDDLEETLRPLKEQLRKADDARKRRKHR